MSKYQYDYYTVAVPGDLAETVESLGQHAIREAEDRTTIYALLCEWEATRIAGKVGDYEVTFRVRRKRIRKR